MPITLIAGLVLLAWLPLEAQRNCTKGIPCGNTCIAANKVCRTATPPPAPSPPSAPLRSTAPAAGRLFSAEYPFAASPRGRTYYANIRSCKALPRLASRVFFKSEEEAQGAGLTRSRQRGC